MRNAIGSGFCSVYDPTDDLHILIAKLSLSGTEEITTETSQGSPYLDNGVLLEYDKMLTERALPLELEFEQLTEPHIALMLNRRATSATFPHPIAQKISMAAATATVTGLVEDQAVQIVELLSVAPGQRQLTQVPTGVGEPVAAGTFTVTADTVNFHADDVATGKTAGIRYMSSSTKLVYGGPNAISGFDSVEIYAEQVHTKAARRAFYFPKVYLESGAQFAITAGGDAVTLSGSALIDSSKGFVDYFASWLVD
jgi:hypothetical protein